MKKMWENHSLVVFVIVVAVGAYTAARGMMLGICWLVDKVTDLLDAYRRRKKPIDDSEDDGWMDLNEVTYVEKG